MSGGAARRSLVPALITLKPEHQVASPSRKSFHFTGAFSHQNISARNGLTHQAQYAVFSCSSTAPVFRNSRGRQTPRANYDIKRR